MIHLAVAINDKDDRLIPKLVSLFTFSAAYHTELVFSNGDAIFASHTSGVTWVQRDYNPYNWVNIPLPWIGRREQVFVREWCDALVQQDAQYDWSGAIFGGIWNNIEDPNRWFCSELCAAAIRDYTPPIAAYGTKKWWSPRELWKVCSDYLVELKSDMTKFYSFRLDRRGLKSEQNDEK